MKISLLLGVSFLLISATAFADVASTSVLPPKYLSVPQWQSCVGTVTKGSAQFICLPTKKPAACPSSSWKALLKLHEIDNCS